MKKTKYLMLGGYAFSENSDMKKLKKLAKEGWILDGVSLPILSYRLIKGEPQDLDFAIDYQKNVDEDYFALFESAGWKHELTMGDEIHLFSAPEGTKPIYSDKPSEIDRLQTITQNFKKPSLYSLIAVIIMMAANMFLLEKGAMYLGIVILTILAFIALVFTGMPYIGYLYRLRKLKG